jgi:hypothetical protein
MNRHSDLAGLKLRLRAWTLYCRTTGGTSAQQHHAVPREHIGRS